MRVLIILTVAVALVTVACGDAGGGGEEATEPAAAATDPDDVITGTFGGDAELEGGCAWVQQGDTRWNVQYPADYTLSFDPLRLTGPDGETAEEGDTLTVAGRERDDMMTICQVGPVWEATSVTFDE